MAVPRKAFLNSVQNFIANAFSVGIVRRMGPEGTLDCVRKYLKEIDLAAVSRTDAAQYAQTLDDLTEKLRKTMPRGAKKWGVAA